jgi:hypothetical protein
MNTAIQVARAILVGSAALLLLLGLSIWIGGADQLIGIHADLGIVLVLSLWTIAAIAARSGVSIWLVVAAVAWSVGATTLAVFQDQLLVGDWHWVIQVLHLVIAMAMVAWGQILVIATRRKVAASIIAASPLATGSRRPAA